MTTTSARNAGLRRLSRLTRLLAAGALGITAAFSVMAARATAGKAASPAPTSDLAASDQVQTPASGQPPVPTDPGPTATDPAPSDGGLSQDPGGQSVQPAPLAPPVQAPRRSRHTPIVASRPS